MSLEDTIRDLTAAIREATEFAKENAATASRSTDTAVAALAALAEADAPEVAVQPEPAPAEKPKRTRKAAAKAEPTPEPAPAEDLDDETPQGMAAANEAAERAEEPQPAPTPEPAPAADPLHGVTIREAATLEEVRKRMRDFMAADGGEKATRDDLLQAVAGGLKHYGAESVSKLDEGQLRRWATVLDVWIEHGFSDNPVADLDAASVARADDAVFA